MFDDDMKYLEYCVARADIDECKRYKHKACRHGTCYNTDGSFVCTCNVGFVSSADSDACLGERQCLGMLRTVWIE